MEAKMMGEEGILNMWCKGLCCFFTSKKIREAFLNFLVFVKLELVLTKNKRRG